MKVFAKHDGYGRAFLTIDVGFAGYECAFGWLTEEELRLLRLAIEAVHEKARGEVSRLRDEAKE